MDPLTLILLGGGAIGCVFGWAVHANQFCTMGAISDAYLFGSFRRARCWLIAIATALVGNGMAIAAGLFPILDAPSRLSLSGPFLGGFLFGLGMVLAGGCLSRNAVRVGAGSLKALVTLVFAGLVALASLTGVLAGPRILLETAVEIEWSAGLGDRRFLAALLSLGAGVALAVLVARKVRFERERKDVVSGIAMGAMVPAAWILTGFVAARSAGAFEPTSLTFVEPSLRAVQNLTLAELAAPFGVALLAGTIVGAAIPALLGRRWHLEGFGDKADMSRHLTGAVAMGFGGTLAGGCTIGHGLTGLASFEVASLIAMVGITTGALWALSSLERGRWWPLPAGRS